MGGYSGLKIPNLGQRLSAILNHIDQGYRITFARNVIMADVLYKSAPPPPPERMISVGLTAANNPNTGV